MLRGSRPLLTIAVLSLISQVPSFAQNTAPNNQNSQPPVSTASAPAQTNQSASADKADKKDSTTQVPAPKPKKVWTNDDMGDLHQDPTSVSVVGKKKNSKPENNYRYSPPPGQAEYMLKMYRQQLDQLQAQSEAIDKEIANLENAKSGKTVDSTRNYDPWGGRQGDWDAQIAQLRKNKEYVQQQIDSVEEQIRKLN